MTGLKQPLETFKKAARQLLKKVRVGDADACERATRSLRGFSPADFGLMQALHVVAVEHGFRGWSELTETPASELYKAISMARKNRRFDGPTQERVRQILRDGGAVIAGDVLSKPIHLLSIFPITGGGSATLSVAREIARDNARRRPWAFDLGHYQGGLTEEQAGRIRAVLQEEGIPFWERRWINRYWTALEAPSALPEAYEEICTTFGKPTSDTAAP